jgi:hypothetical protein
VSSALGPGGRHTADRSGFHLPLSPSAHVAEGEP